MGKKNDRGKKEQRCLDIAKAYFAKNDCPQNPQLAIDTLMCVQENPQNNNFPDFICENGFIEHFEVTSSKTTSGGSLMKQEEAYFKNSDLQYIVYSQHSHEDFIKSFQDIWDSHIRSLNNRNMKADIGMFMVE